MSDYVSARLDALLASQGSADDEEDLDTEPELPRPPARRPPSTGEPVRERSRPADRDGGEADPTSVTLTLPALQRRHLPVIAGLVVLAVLLSGYAILHARADQVPLPVVSASAPAPEVSGPTPSAEPSRAARLQVHVIGAVKRPGVVRVAQGSRVHDAIAAAGGLTRGAGTGRLNLAQPLTDGCQIVVDGQQSSISTDASGGGSGGPASGAPGATLDLNTATQSQLEALPGVGPVMAGNILSWRQQHGRFSRVEELQEVDGVGPKIYARLAPLVRV